MQSSIRLVFLATAVAALTACGGGGSDAPPAAPVPPPAPAPAPVPAPPPPPPFDVGKATERPYAAGTSGARVQAALNKALTECGFPAVTPIAELDLAAEQHGNYVRLNGTAETHYQTAGRPGFTGVDPTAQSEAAGYTKGAGVAQVARLGAGQFGGLPLALPRDEAYVAGLLAAPYHQAGLLRGSRHMGLSWTNEAGFILNVGAAQPGYLVAATAQDEVIPYPCAASTNVATSFGQERPNPGTRTPEDQQFRPYGPGQQLIARRASDVIRITEVTIREEATGALMAAELVIKRTPNDIEAAIPLERLKPNTTYSTVYKYTLNGVAKTTTVVGWKTGPL